MLFLNSRGRFPPHVFALIDQQSSVLGFNTGKIETIKIEKHVMWLGEPSRGAYGCIIQHDNDQIALALMQIGQAFDIGAGLVLLENQHHTLNFLTKCCQILLNGDISSLIDSSTIIKPEPSTALAQPAAWSKLFTMTIEAPYRLPTELNFEPLYEIVQAKRRAAEDHICAMRGNPDYYLNYAGQQEEHRPELVLDFKGNLYTSFGTPRFWNHIVNMVIIDSYARLALWDVMSSQLALIQSLEEKHANILKVGNHIPDEFVAELTILDLVLVNMSTHFRDLLKISIPASPPLRDLFVRDVVGYECKPKDAKAAKSDKLVQLLLQIGSQSDEEVFIRDFIDVELAGHMNLLENLMQLPGQEDRISPWLSDLIAELSLVAQIEQQLGIYQPWVNKRREVTSKRLLELEANFKAKMAPYTILEEIQKFAKGALGRPTKARFYYPSEKQTKASNESMRKAENNLGLFWGAFDKFVEDLKHPKGKHLHELLVPVTIGNYEVQQTPEWVEPAKKPRTTLNNGQTQSFNDAMSSLTLNPKEDVEPSKKKDKKKTRGEATPDHATPPEPVQPIPAPPNPKPTIAVNYRALATFAVLFPKPASRDQLLGNILWTDFLYAMASLGSESRRFGAVSPISHRRQASL